MTRNVLYSLVSERSGRKLLLRRRRARGQADRYIACVYDRLRQRLILDPLRKEVQALRRLIERHHMPTNHISLSPTSSANPNSPSIVHLEVGECSCPVSDRTSLAGALALLA